MRKKGKTPAVIGTLEDLVKASRRGQREAEMETMGPGFHSTTRIKRSKKTYSRKQKHPGRIQDQ